MQRPKSKPAQIELRTVLNADVKAVASRKFCRILQRYDKLRSGLLKCRVQISGVGSYLNRDC